MTSACSGVGMTLPRVFMLVPSAAGTVTGASVRYASGA